MAALGLEFSHSEYSSRSQAEQLPQAIGNGTTTRSPTWRLDTAGPTSTTSPMNSCPRMSPLRMVGMKPWNRCRSEPQMAVEVTRTMASRALRILGSGTSRTSRLVLPIQQLARMSELRSVRVSGGRSADRFGRALLEQPARAGALGAALGADHLAGLQHLLEPAQVVADLLLGLLPEQLGHDLAERAPGRVVAELDPDLGAVAAGGRGEGDRARVLDLGALQRRPGDQRVGPVLGDLGVPLHGRAGGRVGRPVRAAVARRLHRLQVVHEAGQVGEVAPEGVDLLDRALDRDRRPGLHGLLLRARVTAAALPQVGVGYHAPPPATRRAPRRGRRRGWPGSATAARPPARRRRRPRPRRTGCRRPGGARPRPRGWSAARHRGGPRSWR